MFDLHSQAQVPAPQGHDPLSSSLPPRHPRNCLTRPELRALTRPELRAARERQNSGSLTPLSISPARNDRSSRRFEPNPADEGLLPTSVWRAAETGRRNESGRVDRVPAGGEKEEILSDLWDKENILERKLAEVENARKTAEDRHQKEIAARSTIERRAGKLERKVSEMDDALKNAEKRFQRETNARNAIERHASRIEKKLLAVEETLISSKKLSQRESNEQNMVERRVVALESKLSEMENAHKATVDLRKKETDIRNAMADSISDLHKKVATIANSLKSTEGRYQRAFDSGVVSDKRGADLDVAVRNLQRQLITEKTAVDVERSTIEQLKAELDASNYRLEKEAALLRSERMKTKLLADREAERLNTSSEERVRIAQEKLKVLSSALGEERERSKKLKDALTGVQSELNNFKRKAGSTDVMPVSESRSGSETQEEKSELGRTEIPSSPSTGNQLSGASPIAPVGQDNTKTVSIEVVNDRKIPLSSCEKLADDSSSPPPSGFDESEEQPASRSVDNSQESLPPGNQSASQVQSVPNRDAPTESAAVDLYGRGDHLSRNCNPGAECRPANNEGSASGHETPTAEKERSEEEQCPEQKMSRDVPTETTMTNFRSPVEGKLTSLTKLSQSVPTAPAEHTTPGISCTRKSTASLRGAAPEPRFAPPQKCRALQKFSETQGYPVSRNNGQPFQRYAPSQLFVPGHNRARPWDLDHPENFAPRQHFSFAETPFPLQFAPAQIVPSGEGYSGPQLLAQPYPVDSPQRHPSSRRHPVTTATRSLYSADVAGSSRTQN